MLSNSDFITFGQLLTRSPYEIYVFNAETYGVLYANESGLLNLGLTMETLRDQHHSAAIFCVGKGLVEYLRDLDAIAQDSINFESMNRRSDGSLYPVSVTLRCGHFDGRSAYIALAHDISKSNQTVAEVKAILESCVEGIITINEYGNILIFNKAAQQMFGYDANEAIGENVKRLMPEPFSSAHDDYIQNYRDTGEKKIIGIGREVTGLRKDGSEFPMELSITEVKFHGQRRFTGIVRDISERKAAEQAIAEREKELKETRAQLAHIDRLHLVNEMTAGIAHELNQPLAAISNYANAAKRLAQDVADDESVIAATLNKISHQALRAGQVISRLRELTSKREIRHALVCPKGLITEIVELMEADKRLDKIHLVVDVDQATLPKVEMDSVQIQQVFINLIRNSLDALEHLPSCGNKNIVIGATLLESHKHVRFFVKDNGLGIDPSNIECIFRPFVSNKDTGMGIGLAVSQSIIKNHDSLLKFRPMEPNGAEFYFDLPIDE